MQISQKVVQAAQLRAFCTEVYMCVGMTEEDARIGADILVEADLRAVESHGVMLQPTYASWLEKGEVNARPQLRAVADLPAFALVDGDGGLGHLVSYRAMEMAIDRAKRQGVGVVAVTNSSHNGMVGYFAMQALAHDMVGFCTTSTGCCMPPFGGLDRVTGNNPQAWAVPAGEERPIVADMSHSVVPAGKIRVASWKGESIPEGWAIDQDGNPVTDPTLALKDLILLPFGGPKGYSLATVMEVLGGVMTATTCTPEWFARAGVGRNTNGQFFLALNVGAITPLPEFKAGVDRLVRAIHASRPARGQTRVYAPGEIEFERKEARLRDGIPLMESTYRALIGLAERLHLEAKLP